MLPRSKRENAFSLEALFEDGFKPISDTTLYASGFAMQIAAYFARREYTSIGLNFIEQMLFSKTKL